MWPAKVVLESDPNGFPTYSAVGSHCAFLQMQRDSAKESVAEARENFNAAVNAFKAKQEEVEPLQKGRKDQNNMQRNVQAEFRDLEVRSEQELDAKVPKSSLSPQQTKCDAYCNTKQYIKKCTAQCSAQCLLLYHNMYLCSLHCPIGTDNL